MIQAPSEGTIIANEPIADKYTLPFAPELVQFIKDGHKATTYRLGYKYDYLQLEDVVTITNAVTKEVVGKATVTGKSFTTFQDLPLNTPGHEAYQDKEHQRRIFEGYYAYTGKPIEDDSRFMVLEFELAE
ncbi:MAG: ASCH domain-containing protein [Candidatus Berkelbacteria bacterium]|nr:MAG: ASCH domain-containing protein [Candidatus Berkelbacteria bacterium]QQG51649.1 MAG: ASCH domain-containing protein [Candidatus Berkelbacteria bacterium]